MKLTNKKTSNNLNLIQYQLYYNQSNTKLRHMKNQFLYLITFLFLGLLFTACEDDTAKKNPTLEYKTSAGYTFNDTAIAQGDSVLIGLIAKYNGDDNLKSIEIVNNETVIGTKTFDDTEFYLDITLTKNNAPVDELVFTLKDAGGQTAELSIKIGLSNDTLCIKDNPIIGSISYQF